MKTLVRQLGLAGLLLLAAGGASAGVTVTYNHPENFADLPFASWEREDVLKRITEHFDKLGKALPAGQDLRIEVLDVDLAGREEPGRGARDLRVLRGNADWPRMHLRYWLEQDGREIKSGDEQLSEMDYLNRTNRYFEGEPLRYEKQMMDNWWEKTIGPIRPGK